MIQIIKCYRYITYIYRDIYIWYRYRYRYTYRLYRYRYRHRYRYRYAHCHLPLADWNSGFSMAMFEFEYQRLCLGFNSIHHWTTGPLERHGWSIGPATQRTWPPCWCLGRILLAIKPLSTSSVKYGSYGPWKCDGWTPRVTRNCGLRDRCS
jgi:hypothetical protein